MTEKKMTKRERYTKLLTFSEVQADAEMVKFIEHEMELLAKKNSGEKKPTKQQEENAGLKDVILETLKASGKAMSITEIQKACPEVADLSNQRISALIRQLKDDELVVRTEIKRKAYFKAN